MTATLRIDVWADVACPWCWIGEARLARALAARPDVAAEVSWRPFELQPGLPAGGLDWDDFVRTKFGGPERARAMFAHVAAAGAPDGLAFRFDRMARAANTRDAHRLILWAGDQRGSGGMMEVARALFAANFAEGRDVGDRAVLADVAAAHALDGGAAAAMLASARFAAEVEASQREAEAVGVNGVPFFVLDGRYAFSGAQPQETFAAVLDRVLHESA